MNRNISRALKIVIFVFLIIIADEVLGLIFHKLYFSQTYGQNHSLNYVLSDCKADVLIFGNSRAQHHYDTRIISSALKMSCYNAGLDGGHSILLPYAQIKILLKRYSPRIIILEFSPEGITNYPGVYDRLSILLPYYYKYPEIRPIVLLRSPYERIKLMSSIYPFNSNEVDICRFNTNYHESHNLDYKGYVPLNTGKKSSIVKSIPHTINASVVDPNLVNALEEIIHLCKENNVFLCIVNSPWFCEVGDKQSVQSAAATKALEIIHRNRVNYVDFSSDSAFAGHYELFNDNAHLDNEGARIFSNMLINRLSNTIESRFHMNLAIKAHN